MRSIVRSALVACALLSAGGLLAACQTTGAGTGTTVPSDPVVSQVQDAATQACGYLPAAATVATIIASFTSYGPTVGLVASAADAICKAVTAKSARLGASEPVAYVPGPNGKKRSVRIEGHFVR